MPYLTTLQKPSRREQSTFVLWQWYHSNRNTIARNTIVRHYLYLAQEVAKQILPKIIDIGLSIEFKDLRQSSAIGLIHAIEEYNPEKDGVFLEYAEGIIISAIWDDVLRWIFLGKKDPFSTSSRKVSEDALAYADLISHQNDDVNEEIFRGEVKCCINKELEQLPEECRRVIILHEWEEMSFEAIGETLGTNGSEAERQYKKGMEILRSRLEKNFLAT